MALEPQLAAPLDVAAAVAANALRAQHVQIEGDAFHDESDESDEVSVAHILARQCDLLRVSVRDYRCRVIARLKHEQAEWPDWAE